MMLRVSFACALLAAGAPAAEAAFGKYSGGLSRGEEIEGGQAKLNKVDVGKLRLDSIGVNTLHLEKPAFTDLKLDLPSLSGGLGLQRIPLPGQGSTSTPQEHTGLKVDLHELKQQLGNSLPQLKTKLHVGGGEEAAPLAPPFLDSSALKVDSETPLFPKAGEGLGYLGQLFKKKDQQKVFPPLNLLGKEEPHGSDAAGPTLTEETAVGVSSADKVPGNGTQPATLFPTGKALRGLFSEAKVAGALSEPGITLSDLMPKNIKLLKLPRLMDNGEIQPETAQSNKSTESGATDESGLADEARAPVRRLTLLSALGNPLQNLRMRRDEETINAFEKGVKQLQTTVRRDLADTLATRRGGPADLVFIERLLTKVGLNGLGGPPSMDLSLQERALMEQARRKRLQVEKIRSKYERDIKYLVDELQSSLKGATNYKQRISDIVNDRMYTSSALLSV